MEDIAAILQYIPEKVKGLLTGKQRLAYPKRDLER